MVLVTEEVKVSMDAEHQIDLLNWEELPIVVEDPLGDLDIVHVPLFIFKLLIDAIYYWGFGLKGAGGGA